MKINVVIAGLLIGFLIGCSENKQETTVQSNQQQQESESTATKIAQFDSASFPKDTCGEQPPANGKTDTLTFYPVFVNYSEDNLQAIKDNYCRDAFKKLRKDNGREAIQVSSFISKERANQFTEFLENKLGNVNAEVGKPKIRTVKNIGDVNAKVGKFKVKNVKNIGDSELIETIAKTAQLTSTQAAKLKNMTFKDYLGRQNKIEAIVPTYIPPGFKLDVFESQGLGYKIIYRNTSNYCFGINAYWHGGGAGSPLIIKNLKKIKSSALGEVVVGYTDFDQASDSTSIEVFLSHSLPEVAGKSDRGTSQWNYSFESSPNLKSSEINSTSKPTCNTISLTEAVKIVESLSYLYQDDSRNISFYNNITDTGL